MLDVLIIAALGVGVARGFWTGALRQAASLLGFIIAFVLGIQLMRPVGQLIVSSLGLADTLGPVLGFVAVFLLIQVAAYAVSRLGEGLLRAFRLGFLNRLAGGAVGALKAALLLSVAFLVLNVFDVPGPEARRRSELYAPVASTLPEAWNMAAEQWPEVTSLYERFELPTGYE